MSVGSDAGGAGPASALQILFQRIVDKAQQVSAIRSRARHDMHRGRTRMSIRMHFDRKQVAGRSRRPSRFQRCPLESELVPNSSHVVGMMVDGGLDFSLQHVAPPISVGRISKEQLPSQVVIRRIPKEFESISESGDTADVPIRDTVGADTHLQADFRPSQACSELRRVRSRFGTAPTAVRSNTERHGPTATTRSHENQGFVCLRELSARPSARSGATDHPCIC
jgi:hypothetical protein